MLRRNLPFVLIVLVTAILITIVIWLFARRMNKLEEKINISAGPVSAKASMENFCDRQGIVEADAG